MILTIVFGFHLQMFESPLDDITGNNFKSLNNCIWNVIVTLTSVGYGDISPNSFFGRLVGVIVSFWGVFITSAMFVIVLAQLDFQPRQGQAFGFLLNLNMKKDLKQKAVNVLSNAFLLRQYSNERPKVLSKIKNVYIGFRQRMIEFKKTNIAIRTY